MAQPFQDIRVFYDGLGRTAVAWELDSRFDDPYPHVFELHFARNPAAMYADEYYILGSDDKATFLLDRQFRDPGLPSQAYYRVKLTTPAGSYLSDVKGVDGNVDLRSLGILKELLRKESLALRKDRGAVPGWLFKRRYYGPPCDCTDRNTNTLVSHACVKCAGTGFKDGYFPGVSFPILISGQSVQSARQTPAGPRETRMLQARCKAFPPAAYKDLWLEADTSRLYEVEEFDIIGRLSYQAVAANMNLREMPLADSVSLLISSLKSLIVTQSDEAGTFVTPVVVAQDDLQRLASGLDGGAGLATSPDSPFAKILAGLNILEVASKSSDLSLTPTPTAIPNVADSDIIAPTSPIPTSGDSLDGGSY